MSTEYAPGTVAVATVRGVKGVRVFLDGNHEWRAARSVDGWVGHGDESVTDVRPLVVLDLDDAPWVGPGSIPDLLRDLNERDHLRNIAPQRTAATRWLADRIEAQTKPPRIPEPGVGSIVSAALSRSSRKTPSLRVRLAQGWTSLEATGEHINTFDWDDLVDPTLIRDGVTQ